MNYLKSFATVHPVDGINEDRLGKCQSLLAGRWIDDVNYFDDILDPITGKPFLDVPKTEDISGFISNLDQCPKSGLHNPLKNNDRYIMLGDVCSKAAQILRDEEVETFFTLLIQRVMPKTYNQCLGEVRVTRTFLENFAGDGVRFLGRGFSNPGDYTGQESSGYRWPFGSVVIITPFNFPLEIPALQFLGALFMGNRPLVKPDEKVGVVFEQFLRLLIYCGLPSQDSDLIYCNGSTMAQLIKQGKEKIRMIQFTGSSDVAHQIIHEMDGKVKIEDAGFDWKIIGPDYDPKWSDYVAWQCDEDAYNASGQKCSAQSILFIHENWQDDLLPKLKTLAERRNLNNLSIGPILTWNNKQLFNHINQLLAIPNSQCLFGNESLENHSIPLNYGAIKPTAILVPIEQLMTEYFDLITSEVFGPIQVVISYNMDTLPIVLKGLEHIPHNLSAAVVSNDVHFQQRILGNTVNGTTYVGMRARTTGAPQNHWFGPAGDPRAAGIGTTEAIINTWSGHREIIKDIGPIEPDWNIPETQ
jgi:1-pyrroline-5-carboxylate dehydrogenase